MQNMPSKQGIFLSILGGCLHIVEERVLQLSEQEQEQEPVLGE